MHQFFLYAFLKPKKELPDRIKELKDRAKEIIKRINEGEEVITTVVHLSEVANIIESKAGKTQSSKIILSILSKPNILILDVTKNEYLEAAKIAEDMRIGVNDSLAYLVMKKRGISEIYSFDKDFDKFGDIKRIPKS